MSVSIVQLNHIMYSITQAVLYEKYCTMRCIIKQD